MTGISALFGVLCVVALFGIQEPDARQTVRVFLLVAGSASLLAAMLYCATLYVCHEAYYQQCFRDVQVDQVPDRTFTLWAWTARIFTVVVNASTVLFAFSVLMVLVGLLRYATQAYHVAGEILGVIAASIAILGTLLATLLTVVFVILLNL
jgi:hypothetical protein